MPGRQGTQSLSGFINRDSTLNTLNDLLTKREYLYRSFFLKQNLTSDLPSYLKSNPLNSLFLEVKNSFNYVEVNSIASEISHNFFYNNTSLFQLSFLDELFKNSVISPYINIFENYFLNSVKYNNFNLNSEFYKNQYRPMRKGITNMIRLHATGAIALPIEIRLHILASSKDVIHS